MQTAAVAMRPNVCVQLCGEGSSGNTSAKQHIIQAQCVCECVRQQRLWVDLQTLELLSHARQH